MFGRQLCAYLREMSAEADELERESWANAQQIPVRRIKLRYGKRYKNVRGVS